MRLFYKCMACGNKINFKQILCKISKCSSSSQADKFAVALRLEFSASDKFRIFTSVQILKFYAGDKIISRAMHEF